jgi:glycosyltransferase 2 family protein
VPRRGSPCQVLKLLRMALHLVLPQIPGLERSLRLIVGTSHLLVGAAFVAEVLSELCYAELLGRSVGTISRLGFSSRVRKRGGIERWFMLRLTVTGYGLAHVLPGGGAVATTMTYRVLRRRGLDPEKVGLALAVVSVLVYGASVYSLPAASRTCSRWGTWDPCPRPRASCS